MPDNSNTYPTKPSIDLDFQSPSDELRQKWGYCVWCGGENKKVELKFKTCTHTPIVGEILTGTTSGNVGTVVEVETLTATAGYVHMHPCTGVNEDLFAFTDAETVTGNHAASFVADGKGSEKNYSIVWPRNRLVYYEGKWLCRHHFKMRYAGLHQKDKVRLNIREEREDLWR